MKYTIYTLCFIFLAWSCKKNLEASGPAQQQFDTYKIEKGQHYPNNDSTKLIFTNYTEQKFIAKFDSSAIYATKLASNQSDINKLYGFSDNNMFHQMYSARIGWNWKNNALHLWAYDYTDGIREYKDLGEVAIGKHITCSIKVLPYNYIFSIDGRETLVSRTVTMPTAIGYKLFPYFGGDEPAPHDITILIKEL